MSKKYRIIIFFAILIADLVAVQAQYKLAEFIFKPLIVIWLMSWFVLQLQLEQSSLKKWVIYALFFSWLGDMLLLFHDDHSLFFLFGLSSFLVAHIFYILFFLFIKIKDKSKNKWYIWLIVAIYFAAIINLLFPHLGDMKWPVCIYAVVISCMLLLAMHMLFIKNKLSGLWMMGGALLFVVSDSLLAINKFYQPFGMAGFFVMSTYGLAQLFIIQGAIRYISSGYKE